MDTDRRQSIPARFTRRRLDTITLIEGSGAKWWLWLVLLLALPVPYYVGDTELAPTARLAFLTSIYVGIALEEGLVGTTAMFTQLGAGTTVNKRPQSGHSGSSDQPGSGSITRGT